jgi:hypothetical protein
MAERSPVLELRAPAQRRYIKIGSDRYELRHKSELGWSDQIWLDETMLRLGELLKSVGTGKGAKDEVELNAILDRSVRLALVAPASVINKIPHTARLAVYQVFRELPVTMQAEQPEATPTRRRRAKLSRGSSGSTAATRSRGTNGSRSS